MQFRKTSEVYSELADIEVVYINIFDYFKRKFIGKDTAEITQEEFSAIEHREKMSSSFMVSELALFMAIDLIGKTLSKCRFCTVQNGKEVENAEFYAWNYAPNIHQTKSEFIVELVSKLLIKNEVLIFETVDGQRLIAEHFNREVRALYDDRFTNVTARNWSFDNVYRSRDVIYLKYNSYAVQGLVQSMCNTYEQLMSTNAKKIKRSGSQKAILEIETAATQSKTFKKDFERMLNEDFEAYFGEGDVVLPIYEGMKVTDTSPYTKEKASSGEVNDIVKLRDAAAGVVEKIFHVSNKDDFIQDAIDPIAHMLEQAITVKLYGEDAVIKGNYVHVDTTYAKHYDPISSADHIYKSIGSRMITPAQAQKYCNMVPDSDKSAQIYYMTKNNQTADMAVKEGGEKNA